MRILYLHQYLCPPGGSGNNRSFELAQAWQAQGHQVDFLSSPAYFPQELRQRAHREGGLQMEWEGVRAHILPVAYDHQMGFQRRIRAWLQYYRQGRRLLRKLVAEGHEWDLVYASSTPLTVGELGRRFGRETGTPMVFETVDVWPDVPIGMGIVPGNFIGKWVQARTNRIYSAAEAIVSLSEGMRDQVLSHGVAPEKVHVVHNGTHPQRFPFVERPDRETVTVIYTGTVGKANGVGFLVEAAKEIERRGHAHIRFRVVGKGNDMEAVQAKVEALRPDNLEFVDQVPKEEVSGLLAAADIGAVVFAPYPVLEANSANKFYDYLSSGLPVVLNYEGWQAVYLREEGCGLAAPQGDLSVFCDHIERLAASPELRREMGRKGRELVQKKFDRRILAGRILEIFDQVSA